MAKEKKLSAVIELKDEFSSKMEEIKEKAEEFKEKAEKIKPVVEVADKVTPKVKKMKSVLDGIKKMKNLIKIRAKDEVTPKTKKIQKQLLKLKAKKIALKVKDKATKTIAKVGSKLKAIVKKRWEAKISVKDRASAKLGKIKALMGTLAAGVAIKATLQAGSELQQQKIAMEHFMGVGNEGKSKQQIHQMTGSYIGKLRANANATPYDTPEVLQAGTRAITMANGNTQQAMRMVKMAEDMAASRPDASLEDAIEAISNARMGEFERLKQFGFKGSKEEFDRAGGDFFKMKDAVSGKNVDQVFGGLANKQADTAQGMFSTITGQMKTAQQSLGEGFLEGFKPAMAKIRSMMDKLLGGEEQQDKIMQFGQKLGEAFTKVGEVIAKIGDAWQKVAEMITANMDFGAIADSFRPAIETVKEFFNMIMQKSPEASAIYGALGTAFQMVGVLIGTAVSILAKVVVVAFKAIGVAINAVKKILSVFGKAWTALKTVVHSAVTAIGNVVNTVFGGIKTAINGVKNALHAVGTAWTNLKDKIESNPIVQKIEQVTTGKKGKSRGAFGKSRIPRNDYAVRLHEGERVLTKNEANLLDRRGNGNGVVINMNGITVREEADIDKIINGVVRRMKLAKAGGV